MRKCCGSRNSLHVIKSLILNVDTKSYQIQKLGLHMMRGERQVCLSKAVWIPR
jgi:hypothetical protein